MVWKVKLTFVAISQNWRRCAVRWIRWAERRILLKIYLHILSYNFSQFTPASTEWNVYTYFHIHWFRFVFIFPSLLLFDELNEHHTIQCMYNMKCTNIEEGKIRTEKALMKNVTSVWTRKNSFVDFPFSLINFSIEFYVYRYNYTYIKITFTSILVLSSVLDSEWLTPFNTLTHINK